MEWFTIDYNNTTTAIYNKTVDRKQSSLLNENIDQILPNKKHGRMHYKIGVTGVYNGHVFYTLL